MRSFREDFLVEADHDQASATIPTLGVRDLLPGNMFYLSLRKPDFQRETASWSPDKVVDFVRSFLDGDLIPSVIMWRSPESGYVFLIDGAHRLSAPMAWVHDDYGDGERSRKFYENMISKDQEEAAKKTRYLIGKQIGSYKELLAAGEHSKNSDPVQCAGQGIRLPLALTCSGLPEMPTRPKLHFLKSMNRGRLSIQRNSKLSRHAPSRMRSLPEQCSGPA